jgi:hypothetical protein
MEPRRMEFRTLLPDFPCENALRFSRIIDAPLLVTEKKML